MKEISQFPGGIFELKVYKDTEAFKRGEVQESFKVHNKMTNASLAVIAGLVGNTGSQSAFNYLALGTSNTAVSASHTALQAEISTAGLSRTLATNTRTTTTQTNDTLNLTATWLVTGSITVEEIGVFNASSTGVMLARALTTTKSFTNGQTLAATYTWQAVGN